MGEIPDDQLIHEGIKQNPYPFWFWLFLFTVGLSLFWGVQNWVFSKIHSRDDQQPFFQVTNRELSVFLWQYPERMRVHARNKSGYLPGFQYLDKVTVEVQASEQWVQAPPELLFLYHTWVRQTGTEFPKREIFPEEFQEFLDYAEEWQPVHWPAAPQDYVALVQSLPFKKGENLQTLPETTFPLSVRLSFQGWKNYFKEGVAINAVRPQRKEMEIFLQEFPHYGRPYWRNIEGETYLKTFISPTASQVQEIPSSEIPPFLKAVYYNFIQLHSAKN